MEKSKLKKLKRSDTMKSMKPYMDHKTTIKNNLIEVQNMLLPQKHDKAKIGGILNLDNTNKRKQEVEKSSISIS